MLDEYTSTVDRDGRAQPVVDRDIYIYDSRPLDQDYRSDGLLIMGAMVEGLCLWTALYTIIDIVTGTRG